MIRLYLLRADDGSLFVGTAAGLERWTPDGHLDTSYGTKGHGPLGRPLAVDAEGRIILNASVYTKATEWSVTRVGPDGRPDPTFGFGGTARIELTSAGDPSATSSTVQAAAVRPTGEILVVGEDNRTDGVGHSVHVHGVMWQVTAAGATDALFGDRGLVVTREPDTSTLSWQHATAGDPVVVAGDRFWISADSERAVGVVAVVDRHGLRTGFGDHGIVQAEGLANSVVEAACIDSRNDVVLLGAANDAARKHQGQAVLTAFALDDVPRPGPAPATPPSPTVPSGSVPVSPATTTKAADGGAAPPTPRLPEPAAPASGEAARQTIPAAVQADVDEALAGLERDPRGAADRLAAIQAAHPELDLSAALARTGTAPHQRRHRPTWPAASVAAALLLIVGLVGARRLRAQVTS